MQILAHMQVPGLGHLTVKSHLQKYRRKAEAIQKSKAEALEGLTLLSYPEGEAPCASDSDEDTTQVGESRAPNEGQQGEGRWHALPVPIEQVANQPLSRADLTALPMASTSKLLWKPHLLDQGVHRLDPWRVEGACSAFAKKPRPTPVVKPITKKPTKPKKPCYLTKW